MTNERQFRAESFDDIIPMSLDTTPGDLYNAAQVWLNNCRNLLEQYSEREIAAGCFVVICQEKPDGNRDVDGAGFGEAMPLIQFLTEQTDQLTASLLRGVMDHEDD